ncbi:MAG: hypothetical protein WKF75_00365 [Singulisphaera sp.]
MFNLHPGRPTVKDVGPERPRPYLPSAGPRHAFVRWLNAVEDLDDRTAALASRELRQRHGISVRLASRCKGGRP